MARVYEQRNLERRLSHSADAATWLGDEYQQLLAELRRAEQALVDFKSKNNIVAVSLEDDQNEMSTRRKKLAEQLGAVEVELIGHARRAGTAGDGQRRRRSPTPTPPWPRTRSPRS